MVVRKLHPQKFLSEEERERIVRAISDAEQKTSGEIRVYLERKGKGEVLARAKKIFEKLGMTRTKRRNGVLIYFSLADRAFAVLGDRGIDQKVDQAFWMNLTRLMEQSFSSNHFAQGLEEAIQEIAKVLAAEFPPTKDDIDELPNEIAGNG